MKQIFIDTDMGSDCDDVAAVANLAHFQKLGKINLIGVLVHSVKDFSMRF